MAYIAASFVTQPDEGQAAMGLVVPRMPLTAEAILIVTATVGTTLAPWGLSLSSRTRLIENSPWTTCGMSGSTSSLGRC